MIRSRKTGSTGMISYFSSGFVYAKVANLVSLSFCFWRNYSQDCVFRQILFFRADPRLGLVYLILFILQGVLLPEPTYQGPENLVRK